MSEIRVVSPYILSLLISEFLLLSSPVDVGHIDRTTLNIGVMSSLILLAYYYYLYLCLYAPSHVLEVQILQQWKLSSIV